MKVTYNPTSTKNKTGNYIKVSKKPKVKQEQEAISCKS